MSRILTNTIYRLANTSTGSMIVVSLLLGVLIGFVFGVTLMSHEYQILYGESSAIFG